MDIRPFRGWRYAVALGTDASRLVAPPYDVLSPADKAALLKGSERNIVAVDMPHVPPKEAGPDEEYQGAANLLDLWKQTGVLRQEAAPALYAYEQTFEWQGTRYTRRAMLCGVRATPLGQDVIPHEHTFAGPKADRLKLNQFTRMQLSPIFGFYNDGGAEVMDTLFRAAKGEPHLACKLIADEKLWAVTDAATIEAVRTALANTPVFIADGHHRYTTGMNYRDGLLAAGKIGPDHEANFILFALVEGSDTGLLILPTHRIIRGLGAGFSLEKLMQATEAAFLWKAAAPGELENQMRTAGPGAMGFLWGASAAVARLRDASAMAHAAPDQIDAWRKLDVAVLHKLVIERGLAAWGGSAAAIEYTPDIAVVRKAVGAEGALGACLQATPLPAVEEIALAGASMPHKSTYFYPKLTTGVVLKPLE